MRKECQTQTTCEATVSLEQVVIAMCEIAGAVEEGLLAVAAATGVQVMATMMDADLTAICGPKGRHGPERIAVRHGTDDGSVTLGGRRVPVRRPRVRSADGTAELPVPTYEAFSGTGLLRRLAMEKMLAKLSTRR
jgi:hypothetical protein